MMTLRDLLNKTWYAQELIIKIENTDEVIEMQNYQTRSITMKNTLDRWIRNIGVDDGKLVITLI